MAAPSTGILDNFNRANGALGANWIDLASGVGYSKPLIVSNRLDWPQYPGLLWATQFGQDQEAFVSLNSALYTGLAFALRMANPNTGNESGYFLYCNNVVDGEVELWKFSAGLASAVSLGWFNWVMNGDDYVWVTAIGNTFTLYSSPNGITNWTIRYVWTDSTYLRGGYIGAFNANNQNPSWLDDFGGGSIVTVTLDSCLPDADVMTTGWTTTPLFSKVNDASDATVIQATAV